MSAKVEINEEALEQWLDESSSNEILWLICKLLKSVPGAEDEYPQFFCKEYEFEWTVCVTLLCPDDSAADDAAGDIEGMLEQACEASTYLPSGYSVDKQF